MADALGRNYKVLTGPERFALTIEALARGDAAEADRLEDTCPTHNYHLEDLEFRDRMKRAYMIALLVTINLKWRVEQIKSAKLFCELHRDFARGPTLVATTAFLYGRQYGHWECGAIEQIDLPDQEAVTAELRHRPDLREQLDELREVSADGVRGVAETLKYAIGAAHAVEVLSQWKGFGRFCRDVLGVEALALTAALDLGREDPTEVVLANYPEAKASEAKAAQWAGNWTRSWERRFMPT